jgi:Flp pilus assembly pilin Flp
MAHRALHDERGGEILEYSLIIGLIVVGSVATITCVGSKVLTKWNSVNSGV